MNSVFLATLRRSIE
uniref:Uncharacterized protein n=1 Tax=Amphimedon queenslandica TaxID=400682 RepID=A0A1X7SQH7_AMPQE